MEARINRTEARISCSPWGPCQGKCGERIHSSSGIMAIRLIVMELGRFTVFPLGLLILSESRRCRNFFLNAAETFVPARAAEKDSPTNIVALMQPLKRGMCFVCPEGPQPLQMAHHLRRRAYLLAERVEKRLLTFENARARGPDGEPGAAIDFGKFDLTTGARRPFHLAEVADHFCRIAVPFKGPR